MKIDRCPLCTETPGWVKVKDWRGDVRVKRCPHWIAEHKDTPELEMADPKQKAAGDR